MFENFQVNIECNNNFVEAMKVCEAHPQCIDCPLINNVMNINNAAITCVNAQIFQKGNK